MAGVLETRLLQAQVEPMAPIDLLSTLVSDELARRSDRLLERRRSKIDERQIHVWLTEAGRAVLVQSDCLGETLMERSGMTPEEFGQLNKKLQALRSALDGERKAGALK